MLREIEALVDEVRLTFHSLGNYVRSAHEEVDPSERAVLEFLATHPPTTVPDIARARGVSRQHIQTIVNRLRDHEFVEVLDNAAHRRSPLIVLSTQGAEVIERVVARERTQLSAVFVDLDVSDVRTATAILTRLRGGLDGVVKALPT